jgi:hypothetical protein
MERITLEEAQKYIALKDDYTGLELKDCAYYTIEPSSTRPGWEKVTYYTNRYKVSIDNASNRKLNSWVYVLSNPTMPGLYKIGSTSKTPEERAVEISRSTAIPVDFKVEFAFYCYDSNRLEKEIHKKLHKYRLTTNKEHFRLPLEEAKNVIIELGKNYI